ncbi:ESX secretion-associated protein EspG [Nocardia sp. NBC_00565]|uniref:ESX secretion-associated protein EspG n=1 Tax=Nocardia sp. NBC_00565 TaxID=2975993 RepID=UPI002E809723|nr:ESX secretion-associated protein EspG [Nocardia sp. NBC_00565]WUC04560.1 ESX secretion-associated protein EspG [Nocardia sp. NBC_00565]
MTTARRWRFTALEFRVLWESTGRDVLPYPLRHRSTEVFQEDSDRLRRAAAEVVVPQLDEDLVRAVEVLLAPEARVEVAGFHGPRNERKIRAHGGVHFQHGALAIQEPGLDHEHGGAVDLLFLSADDLVPAVVDVLPECPVGQGKPMQVPIEELEKPPPVVRDAWRPTVREEFDKFFRRPTTATVHVGVYPLGSVDNRHTKGRKDFQITDFENDGRYVSFGSRTVIVKPTDRQRITATLREMIGRTVEDVRNSDHMAR